jgi:hypothetical protein
MLNILGRVPARTRLLLRCALPFVDLLYEPWLGPWPVQVIPPAASNEVCPLPQPSAPVRVFSRLVSRYRWEASVPQTAIFTQQQMDNPLDLDDLLPQRPAF